MKKNLLTPIFIFALLFSFCGMESVKYEYIGTVADFKIIKPKVLWDISTGGMIIILDNGKKIYTYSRHIVTGDSVMRNQFREIRIK